MDVSQYLEIFLEACKILGISNEETVEVEASMKKLSMPTIANDGRLMEWTESSVGHIIICMICILKQGCLCPGNVC